MAVTISEEQRQKAKEKAIDFLNQNIVSLAMMLNVDTATLTSAYEIPVSNADPDYPAYTTLVKMVTNLEALEA
jgi:hypothetical protein